MKLIISALLLISATSYAQKATDVVAQVGKKSITVEDFNKKYFFPTVEPRNPDMV